MGILELNNVVQGINYVNLDISILPPFIMHTVLNQAIKDTKAREHMVYEQLKQSKTTVTNLEAESVIVVEKKEQLW